ncbi:hypothetical protein ElyMa_005546200 [Elysia marginata]|uniref:Uncharacterized protein n=1 Tax=Elysia marginata TaxID=1093978 RepID=A0AAV4EZL0_9GAST|nr:hypothetical protein ElyMa_005546200 [Elysia marginata]
MSSKELSPYSAMKSSSSSNNGTSSSSGSNSGGGGSTSGSGSGKSRASRSKARRSPYPQSTATATASSSSTETPSLGSNDFVTEYPSSAEKSSNLDMTGHASELGVSTVLPPPALQPVPYPNMVYTHPGSAEAAVGMGMGVGVDRYSALYSTPYNHPGMTMYRDAACVYSPYQAAAHAHHHQRYLDNRSPYRYYEERYYPARDPAAYPGYLSSAAAIQSAAASATHIPRLSHLSLDSASIATSRDHQPCQTQTSSDGMHHHYDFRTSSGVEDGSSSGAHCNANIEGTSNSNAGSSAISHTNLNNIPTSGGASSTEIGSNFRSEEQNARTSSAIQNQSTHQAPSSRSTSREAPLYGNINSSCSNNSSETNSAFGISHQHQHPQHPGPYSNRSESSASDVDVGSEEQQEKNHRLQHGRDRRHGSYSHQQGCSTANTRETHSDQQQHHSVHDPQFQQEQQQHLKIGDTNSNHTSSSNNSGVASLTESAHSSNSTSNTNSSNNKNKNTNSVSHQHVPKEDSYYGHSDSKTFQAVSPPHREACIPQSVIIRRQPANTSSASTYPSSIDTSSSPSNFNASPCSQQNKLKQTSPTISSPTYSSSLSSSIDTSNHLALVHHQNTNSLNTSSPSSSSQHFSTTLQHCQAEPSQSTVHHTSNNHTQHLQQGHNMLQHYINGHHQYSNYHYLQSDHQHNLQQHQHHHHQQQHYLNQDQMKTPISASMSHNLEIPSLNGRSPGSTDSAEEKLYELSNDRNKHYYGSSPTSSSKHTTALSAVTSDKTMCYDMGQQLSSSPTPANSYYEVTQAGTPDQAKLFTDLTSTSPKLYDMSSASTVNKLYEMSSGIPHSAKTAAKSIYDVVPGANSKLHSMATANTTAGKFYDMPTATASKFYEMHTPATHSGYHHDKMSAVQGSALSADDYSSCLKAAAYGYDNYSQAADMYQQAAAALHSQRPYHQHHSGMPQAGYTSVIVDPQQYHVANGYAVH